MQPLTIARHSYLRGRHDEILASGKWFDALVEDVADLVALAFLDGCEFAGADLASLDEERAAAVRHRHQWAARMLRAAVLDWQGRVRTGRPVTTRPDS